MQISRSTTFAELELILYEEIGMDRNNVKLNIFFKYITFNFGQRNEMLLAIKKDRDMQFFLNPVNGYVSIDIFVEFCKMLYQMTQLLVIGERICL